MRTAFTVLTLVVALTSSAAQKVELCKARTCTPPPTFTYKATRPPLNTTLVRYGGEVQFPGAKYWLWVKAAEGTPCTAAQKAAKSSAGDCVAKIGDPLFITMPFTLTE